MGLLTGGTNIGNMTAGGGLAAAFDGNTNQADAASARLNSGAGDATAGKDWGAGTAYLVSQARLYATNDTDFYAGGNATNVTLLIQESSNGSSWTTIGSVTRASNSFANSEVVTINCSGGTAKGYHQAVFPSNASNNRRAAEVEFYGGIPYTQAVDAGVDAAVTVARASGFAKAIAAGIDAAAALSVNVGKLVSAGCDGAVSVARATSKIVSAGVDGAVTVTRAISHLISVGIDTAATTIKNVGKVVTASIKAAVSITTQKTRVLIISIGVDASVSVRRAIAFTVRPALDLLASVTWRLRPDQIIANIRGGSGRATISAGGGRATISAGGGRAIIRRR